MKKMAGILISMVLLLSLTACTGQSPAADSSENGEGTALGASSVLSAESGRGDISERQEESMESSLTEEGVSSEGEVSSEETVSSGSYPYDSVFPQHEPYGQGIGAMPGRVVWAYDTDSVLWDGDGYWWKPDNFDEKVILDMVNDSIASLGGEETAEDGWNALFLAHNMARDKGSTGYTAGEKIVIKANINGSGVFDDDTSGETQMSYTNPVLLKTLLASLVEEADVAPSDITVYDVSRLFPDYMVELCTEGILDGVRFVDRKNGIADEDAPINWSYEFSGAVNYLPTCVTEADYMINLANLKGHSYGITLCGKNHFGSFINGNAMRPPEGANLHQFLTRNEMGSYSPLTDLMANEQLGGKTVLYLLDALICATSEGASVTEDSSRWQQTPFNGNYTSSVFVSQDPVAIDSVGADFLINEPAVTDRNGALYVSVDVISQKEDFGRYKVVFAPMLYLFEPGTKERIRDYIAAGGIFVMGFYSGLVNENDLVYEGFAPHGLNDVFGVRAEEIDCLCDEERNHFRYGEKEYACYYYCELLQENGAEVLSRYEEDFYSGKPVLTRKIYGRGTAYYLACRTDMDFLTDFCHDVLKQAGVRRTIEDRLKYGQKSEWAEVKSRAGRNLREYKAQGTVSSGKWGRRGWALDFTEEQYYQTLREARIGRGRFTLP